MFSGDGTGKAQPYHVLGTTNLNELGLAYRDAIKAQ
jgi:hypothetical protein